MVRILIVYDSRTGNTEKMALAVEKGAKEVGGTVVVTKNVQKATMQDLLDADGIILGSPTYYGDMSGRLKEYIDKSFKIHGKLKGKVGGAFTSSGGTACGAETAILAMLHALLVHGMIVQGRNDDKHYGPAAVEAPGKEEEKLSADLGRQVATLAKTLRG